MKIFVLKIRMAHNMDHAFGIDNIITTLTFSHCLIITPIFASGSRKNHMFLRWRMLWKSHVSFTYHAIWSQISAFCFLKNEIKTVKNHKHSWIFLFTIWLLLTGRKKTLQSSHYLSITALRPIFTVSKVILTMVPATFFSKTFPG